MYVLVLLEGSYRELKMSEKEERKKKNSGFFHVVFLDGGLQTTLAHSLFSLCSSLSSPLLREFVMFVIIYCLTLQKGSEREEKNGGEGADYDHHYD